MPRPSRTRTLPPAIPAAPLDDRFARLEAQFSMLKAKVRQAQQLAGLGAVAPLLAHEVCNLFTPMVNYAKQALAGTDVDLMKKALQVTVRSSELAVAMADRLLKLGAAGVPARQPVNVRTTVEDAYACLCRDLTKDGTQVRFEIEADLSVIADPLQIQQVLFNLFLNAHEAMKGSHNARLLVSAQRETTGRGPSSPDRVTIEVRNTGKTIPPELLPHIFDALESTKNPEHNGSNRCSGLGLALCRDLIEENGGTISVTSDAQRGTSFVIRLPASPSTN